MCFSSHLLSLLVSTKQWSFATSTLFRLSWSTTGWLSRLRRLQNKKLRSRYSLLLTHMYIVLRSITHPRFIVLLTNNIWSSNPITPAHSPHHHHKEIPRRKKHYLGKLDVEPGCWLTHITCGFNCRPCVLPIRSLGLCNSACILHNGLIRRVGFFFLTSVEIIFQRSLLKQVGLVNMSE